MKKQLVTIAEICSSQATKSNGHVCMSQGKTFAGWLARTFPAFRDRLIEDPRFFFKVAFTPSQPALPYLCACGAAARAAS